MGKGSGVGVNFGLGTNETGNSANEFVRSVTNYDYKYMCMASFNGAKAVIIATAQRDFPAEFVSACWLSVDGLANMIIPYINSQTEQSKLNRILSKLDADYNKLASHSKLKRALFVKDCQKIINILTPHLNKIGVNISNREEGEFKLPEKVTTNIMDIKEDEL